MKKLILALAAVLVLASCAKPVTHCVNPLTYTDIPDNDVIRVGKDYYMVSTTMYFCPGAPIMHSKDLVHWEIISYIYDYLADDDIYNLQNGRNAYGKGQWATSLRYVDGTYYALFIANDQRKTYVYYTDDITKSYWKRNVIDRPFHDASLLFEDGHVYVVWGNGDLRITELKPDLTGVLEGGVDQLLISAPRQGINLRAEGAHIYHIGDYYYVLEIDWPRGGVRTETCWRSKELLGEYESKVVLQGKFDGRNDGVAQGAIFDTPKGDWYAVMFQDHGAVGRIPTLQPVKWEDDWPILGDETVPVKEFDVNLKPFGENRVWASDEFDATALDLVWQWNHKPVDSAWSLSERPGWMTLSALPATKIADARNTLTQRSVGPACESAVKYDVSGLKPGDHAGFCAFQSNFAALEIEVAEDGTKALVGLNRQEEFLRIPFTGNDVCFKLIFDFNTDRAKVAYSLDGNSWTIPDYELQMRYTLDYFTGYRPAIYCYNSTGVQGGKLAVDWFHQEQKGL
ncbi:MAG: glycoside hydrolase 43 family protein [Bacteroidales bacterium]|nr:glycoside hydrolase 43 family protein [Bacteroidales bacterium]